MTVLECVDAGLSRQNTDKPRPTDTRVAAIASVPAARSRFRASLDRLAALMRPLMGGSGDTGRPTQPLGPDADPQLRRAQTLALAGRLATGLVHDFNNALLVAVASLDPWPQRVEALLAHPIRMDQYLVYSTVFSTFLTIMLAHSGPCSR